jgi:diacylglycerol kinase (ATP)
MQQARRVSATVILNPTSGGGAAARVAPEIERELRRRGVEFELVRTCAPGHALELAARAAREHRPDFIVAAGGDGTAHEVANAILASGGHAVALAVLPIGTGNDFVKVVPGLRPRAAGYDTIAAGHTRVIDAGHVAWGDRSEFFINGMGTGIDVEVVRQIERYRHLPRALVYLVALLKALTSFRAIPIRARANGEMIDRKVMMLALGNGRCVGGAFWLTPDASPEDGLLDVCVVDEVRGLGIARALPRVLRGTHGSLDIVSTRRARAVEIDVPDDRPLYFQLDGELREAGEARCLRVELRPAVLRVASTPGAGTGDGSGHGGDARSEQVRGR